MLFHFKAFLYLHYSQISYEASNAKEWDLEKLVRASLTPDPI